MSDRTLTQRLSALCNLTSLSPEVRAQIVDWYHADRASDTPAAVSNVQTGLREKSPAGDLRRCTAVRLARLAADDAGGRTAEHQAQREFMTEKRDRFIAGRVNGMLKVGEIRLILLGSLHAMERLLPPHIETVREDWWAASGA
jgi:hypothetical protein